MIATLAHFSNEPHVALSAALAVFACGVGAGICIGLIVARKSAQNIK